MSIHHCWRSFGFLHSGAFKGKVGSRGAPLLWWISLTIVRTLQGKQSFCGGQTSTWILWIYLLLLTCLVEMTPIQVEFGQTHDQNTWLGRMREQEDSAIDSRRTTWTAGPGSGTGYDDISHADPLFLSLTRCDKPWIFSSCVSCGKL